MARTTAEAFNEFKDKLQLTAPQTTLVNSRRDNVIGYLRSAFPSSSDLPFALGKLIGSAGRETIIRPIDDIDLLAKFSNQDNIFERYRHDSRSFLYRVRDALTRFRVQVVGARGQAVRLFYTNPPNVDIAPVFGWGEGGYVLPDGQGGWIRTDPDFHAQYFAQRDHALGYLFKPMVRMLKRWNNEHGKYFRSFHLEVVINVAFSSIGNDSRIACEKFFEWAPTRLEAADPAGNDPDLSSYLTPASRQQLLANLASARQRARNANAAERSGRHQEAIRLWRIIFGSEFPAYG